MLIPLARRALLRLADESSPGADFRRTLYWRWLVPTWLVAAPLVVAAYALERGPLAAALTGPWALVTLLLARLGVWRSMRRDLRASAELAIDAALVFQIVGGGWLVVERSGWDPYGFGPVLLQLTVVHTHLSPLVLLLLLGLTGRSIGGRWTAVAATLSLTGFPLVAAGIIGRRELEWVGALALATGGIVTAFLQLRLANDSRRSLPRTRRALLTASSLCLLTGMVLAALFVASWACGWALIGRSDMLVWHGTLLAVGFGVVGLLAHV